MSYKTPQIYEEIFNNKFGYINKVLHFCYNEKI